MQGAKIVPRTTGLHTVKSRGWRATVTVPSGGSKGEAMTRVCLQCGQQTEGLYCPVEGMATIVANKRPSSGDIAINTVFAGRYRVVGTLGRGGMGAVYDAQHTGTGQRVAIKTLLIDPVQEPQAVKRFFLEAKITAGLQHPNTIRVFDFGQSDDGVFFLAMERLQGETLTDRLHGLAGQGTRMTEQEAATVACAVLRSLAEAHRVNLVHRDLKPGNIFLHDLGAGETVVKVLDFGIAKQGDAQLTQAGTAMGTPAYMSPEQVMGAAISGTSDLYSLGVVLFQCVTGQVPFKADSTFAVMMKHINEAPPDITALGGVSPAFAAVVEKALQKQANDRFATAIEMREALEPLAQGQHVHAPGSAIPPGGPPPGSLQTGATPAAAVPAGPPPPPPDRSATRPASALAGAAASQGAPPPRPPPFVATSVSPPAPPKSRSLVPLYVVGMLAIIASAAVAVWLHAQPEDKAPVGAVPTLATLPNPPPAPVPAPPAAAVAPSPAPTIAAAPAPVAPAPAPLAVVPPSPPAEPVAAPAPATPTAVAAPVVAPAPPEPAPVPVPKPVHHVRPVVRPPPAATRPTTGGRPPPAVGTRPLPGGRPH